MKLPRNFGGSGFTGMLKQAQEAMAKAQQLEEDLAEERIEIDKGPVKATFNGKAEIMKLKIDPSVVDPSDVEALEDLILSAVRDGFNQATEMRQQRVQEIMPNMPNIPGL
jgi:DNA-binding YbaB/EbfC family protein